MEGLRYAKTKCQILDYVMLLLLLDSFCFSLLFTLKKYKIKDKEMGFKVDVISKIKVRKTAAEVELNFEGLTIVCVVLFYGFSFFFIFENLSDCLFSLSCVASDFWRDITSTRVKELILSLLCFVFNVVETLSFRCYHCKSDTVIFFFKNMVIF